MCVWEKAGGISSVTLFFFSEKAAGLIGVKLCQVY
jgi:hypothetical protein